MAHLSAGTQSSRGDQEPLRSRAGIILFGLSSVTVLGVVCLLLGYVSFRYPIKWDRYHHSFFEHIVDRAKAYALLVRSPHRGPNVLMPVASIDEIVRQAADEHVVDRCLVIAVVIFESAFNPNTVTTTGAMGLMALQPQTARILNVQDPYDPRQNIDGGARLLAQLSSEFGGDVRLVLAAYNAGPKSVKRHGAVPPYRETRDYVRHVGRIHELCTAQPAIFFPPAGAESDER